jgi:hypothetical protein
VLGLGDLKRADTHESASVEAGSAAADRETERTIDRVQRSAPRLLGVGPSLIGPKAQLCTLNPAQLDAAEDIRPAQTRSPMAVRGKPIEPKVKVRHAFLICLGLTADEPSAAVGIQPATGHRIMTRP